MGFLLKLLGFIVIFAIIHSSLACGNKNRTRTKRDIGSDFGGLVIGAGAAIADFIQNAGVQSEFHAKIGEKSNGRIKMMI